MIQKPAWDISIGGTNIGTADSRDAICVSVFREMDVPLDTFSLVAGTVKKAGAFETGDKVSIKLGYEDSLERVFTGTVGSVRSLIKGVEICGYSLARPLVSTRISQVYEKQSCGAMVKDLAGKSGISVEEASEGLNFPMYAIDETKSLYEHMKELSALCGFDLYMTGEGRLVFKRYQRGKVTRFVYGKDILDACAFERAPGAAGVKVFVESPSSFRGPEKWHWLSKKTVDASSGKGEPLILVKNPAVRDKDTADKISAAVREASGVTKYGTVKTPGNAAVNLGDTIEIAEMPDDRMNGHYAVTGVSHHMNARTGFISFFDAVEK